MTDSRFNLLDEPWIQVGTDDGAVVRVGMLEAVLGGERYTGLAQGLSTQRFAVLRLLLAFCHRALGGPRSAEDWLEYWEEGLPSGRIHEYADRVRDRFWMQHPTAPFFQTPGLQTKAGPEAGLRKIVPDLPDGEAYFTNRTAEDVARVHWAEAAELLVHLQAYDTAGIKTGAVDDPWAKGGKGYGYGLPAWAGQIGGISARGGDLRETLLLNLRPLPDITDDLPAWERGVPTSFRGSDPEYEPPVSGQIHLLTWQSRRVLLEWDGENAVGVMLCQGDRITPQVPPKSAIEGMTSWRYSKPQSDRFGTNIFMPQQHDPARQAWRGVSRLLGLPEVVSRKGDVPPPVSALVEWLARVEDHLGADLIRVELAGYEYGAQNATYAEVVDDSIGIPAALMVDGPAAEPWRAAVSHAVRSADEVAFVVRRLAENLARCAGADQPDLPRWQERFHGAADLAFRRWLAGLDPGGDLTSARTDWQRTCRELAWGIRGELLASVGPNAYTGKAVDGDTPLTPALADIWFHAGLRKLLPLAFDETQETIR